MIYLGTEIVKVYYGYVSYTRKISRYFYFKQAIRNLKKHMKDKKI